MSEGTKGLLRSRTVIGGLLALLPLATELLNEVSGIPGLPAHVAAGVAAAGGVLAIVGRLAAKVRISGLF